MATKLIIDTDVALGAVVDDMPRDIDDGFAMVEAINDDRIDLLGVTTVYGNAPHATVNAIAREIVALKNSTVPVIQGAQAAMDQSRASELPPSNTAVEFMAEQLSRHRLTIAAIGPLTNIGLLAVHYPELMHNVEQLIIVAGRSPGREFYVGSAGPVSDFNFENDARATELALGSAAPCVSMGFELTSQVCITATDLETIRAVNTAAADYFYQNSLAWCKFWTTMFADDAGFHPWDSAAIAWILNPEYFIHEQRAWRIAYQDEARQAPWLECDATFAGPQLTYCTGFAPGCAQAFVRSVVDQVY